MAQLLCGVAGSAVDPRSLRPPLSYTDGFSDRSLAPVTLTPIGRVQSPYQERFGTPRQPQVTTQVAGGGEQEGSIILAPGMGLEHSLRGLDGFSYCWVVTFMHLNTGWRSLVKPPRGPTTQRQGIFATRSPHRPNQLALSALRILSVDEASLTVRVRGLDLLDGTPVLDIKPYVPYCDAFPDAKAGWVDQIRGDEDRLAYWPPPPHLRDTAGGSGQEQAPPGLD
jgi:tRNA-Thr(GGU) m(6)t(6)A37 methyltransferase TsaA